MDCYRLKQAYIRFRLRGWLAGLAETQVKVLWRDSRPSRAVAAAASGIGYVFFWGTELLLLYWLAQEMLGKSRYGFVLAASVTFAWTIVSTLATVRLRKMLVHQKLLYLTSSSIGVIGSMEAEIRFAEVEKIIVAHGGDGFIAQVTAQETQFYAPLRDRKGFLDACKQITALKGKIASTGILEDE